MRQTRTCIVQINLNAILMLKISFIYPKLAIGIGTKDMIRKFYFNALLFEALFFCYVFGEIR